MYYNDETQVTSESLYTIYRYLLDINKSTTNTARARVCVRGGGGCVITYLLSQVSRPIRLKDKTMLLASTLSVTVLEYD